MICALQPIVDGTRLQCTRCGRIVRRIGDAPPSAYQLHCTSGGRPPTHAARVTPRVEPADLPCVHRSSEPTGQAACALCGGGVRLVDLFSCGAKGGTCSTSRVSSGAADGSDDKPWCCLGCPQRQEPPGSVTFVRPPADVRGRGLHLAGWPWAMAALRHLAAPAGSDALLLDDFVEHTFAYPKATKPHRRPWVGIFHHPPPPSPIPGAGVSAAELLDVPALQESLPHLRGAICLSEHLAAYLRTRLACPVATVKYPGGRREGDPWSLDAWQAEPVLWSLGWWLRNTRLLYHLPRLPGIRKRRTLPATGWPRSYDGKVAAAHLRPEYDDQVETSPLLSADDYRGVLRRGVLVSELLASSANTVVCEAIAYATPHLVNPHPAVVEYLGPDYPLYWRDLRDVPRMLADGPRLLAAHQYLLELPTEWLDPATFAGDVSQFLDSLES
jgi:hypothetical protein